MVILDLGWRFSGLSDIFYCSESEVLDGDVIVKYRGGYTLGNELFCLSFLMEYQFYGEKDSYVYS